MHQKYHKDLENAKTDLAAMQTVDANTRNSIARLRREENAARKALNQTRFGPPDYPKDAATVFDFSSDAQATLATRMQGQTLAARAAQPTPESMIPAMSTEALTNLIQQAVSQLSLRALSQPQAPGTVNMATRAPASPQQIGGTQQGPGVQQRGHNALIEPGPPVPATSSAFSLQQKALRVASMGPYPASKSGISGEVPPQLSPRGSGASQGDNAMAGIQSTGVGPARHLVGRSSTTSPTPRGTHGSTPTLGSGTLRPRAPGILATPSPSRGGIVIISGGTGGSGGSGDTGGSLTTRAPAALTPSSAGRRRPHDEIRTTNPSPVPGQTPQPDSIKRRILGLD